jgi:hypothetical protein
MGVGDLSTMSTIITLHIVLFSSMTLVATNGVIFVIYVGSIVSHELKQDTKIMKKTTYVITSTLNATLNLSKE